MTCEHKAPARSAACGRGWPPGSKRRSSSRRPGTGPRTSPGGGQAVLLWRWGGVLPPTIVRGEAKSRWWGCVQLPLPGNATAGAYGGVEVRAEVKPKKNSQPEGISLGAVNGIGGSTRWRFSASRTSHKKKWNQKEKQQNHEEGPKQKGTSAWELWKSGKRGLLWARASIGPGSTTKHQIPL